MNFYRASLNFPIFRNIGVDKMNPYQYETPSEYLKLDAEDGKTAEAFFYNILVICRENFSEDYELFSILAIMRAVGIIFVPHEKFGFVIKPIEGVGAWKPGQYDDFKRYLKKYQNEIIYALNKTRESLE